MAAKPLARHCEKKISAGFVWKGIAPVRLGGIKKLREASRSECFLQWQSLWLFLVFVADKYKRLASPFADSPLNFVRLLNYFVAVNVNYFVSRAK